MPIWLALILFGVWGGAWGYFGAVAPTIATPAAIVWTLFWVIRDRFFVNRNSP